MGATLATAVTMVAGARTAVRPVDGELAGWNPVVLGGVVGREVLERAGLDAGALDAGVLDEVVVGCCDPVGAAGADAARAIVLAAGWPVGVGGLVVDRGETSGLAAVQAAVAAIRCGQARTVLVIGLGLCSVVPPGAAALNRTYGAPWGGVAERFAEVGGLLPGPRLAERAARAAGIGRAELDAAAEESRRRRAGAGSHAEAEAGAGAETGAGVEAGAGAGAPAQAGAGAGTGPQADAVTEAGAAAQAGAGAGAGADVAVGAAAGSQVDTGAGAAIVAVAARPGDAVGRGVYRGDPVAADVVRDWGETAELPPAFDDDGLLTAATFAPPADAVAAVLLQAAESPATGRLAAVTGMGRAAGDPFDPVGNVGVAAVTGMGRAAGDPFDPVGNVGVAAVTGMGRAAGDPFDPVGNVGVAVDRALAEAGVPLSSVDCISVVEHDAATAMLVARALGIDKGRINRGGGAVATGNAGAAEELRLITDGLAGPAASGRQLLLTISAGPTGSAAILWE